MHHHHRNHNHHHRCRHNPAALFWPKSSSTQLKRVRDMGSDHSMHLQSCSADFQDEYCDVFENWSHAVRSIRGNATGQKLQKAVQIDKNIRASLQQCWSMSNGQYPVFEKTLPRHKRQASAGHKPVRANRRHRIKIHSAVFSHRCLTLLGTELMIGC